MITEQELKTRLHTLQQAGEAALSEAGKAELLEAMQAHIGTLDSELRDGLIYTTFARWMKQDCLSPGQLRDLHATALDEQHLFYHLGEQDPDAVFTRSFSMLLLALLLYTHRRRPFLAQEQIQQTKQRVVDYLGQEKDWRGYVAEKGWAHAAAHASDAVDELVRCEELGKQDLLDLLNCIRDLAAVEEMVYTHEEDERMSVAVVGVLERQALDLADWQAWIDSLLARVEEPKAVPSNYYCRTNVKHFLRSVFFRLRRPTLDASCDPSFEETLIASCDPSLKETLIACLDNAIKQVTKF